MAAAVGCWPRDSWTIRTPALELINEHLVWAATTPDARLIVSMPPQQGKSQLCSRAFPLWLLSRDPGCRIVLASSELGLIGGKARFEKGGKNTVTISRGFIGSYNMVINDGGAVYKVKRLK